MIIKLSELDKKNKYYIFGGSLDEINKIKKNRESKNISFTPHIPYSKVRNEHLKK